MERDASSATCISAIILAGSRPGTDALAAAYRVETKALAPIAGRPMIDHVARVLAEHPAIGEVVVMAQQPARLVAHPITGWMAIHDKVRLVNSGEGISQSLLDWMDSSQARFPALVTTADNVLLDATMLNSFIAGASGADIAAAMVERRVVLDAYPDAQRTWLKFRGGAWSGANLFWLGGPRAANALRKWREIEQDRKKGWKIVSAFGPALLLGAGLRLLTIHQAVAQAGRRLGADARIVPLPLAEACIDADKPEDIVLIERIMGRRGLS